MPFLNFKPETLKGTISYIGLFSGKLVVDQLEMSIVYRILNFLMFMRTHNWILS